MSTETRKRRPRNKGGAPKIAGSSIAPEDTTEGYSVGELIHRLDVLEATARAHGIEVDALARAFDDLDRRLGILAAEVTR